MTELRLADMAKGSNIEYLGAEDAVITNIVIDSREAKPGSLFVCIVGEINDGHAFAEKAYDLGCRAFLMSNNEVASSLKQNHGNVNILLAENTEEAFRTMAVWYMDQIKLQKIGVTGSVGKTTTKALTAAVLGEKYNVVCSQKNYNTNLGLCMTAFLANPDTDFIVFEMGMDRKNEIHEYCSWVHPDAALITIVGDSHLEKLGSKEAIADAKLEITHFMTKENTLIYNADSPFLDAESIRQRTKMNFEPVPVGTKEGARVRISNVADHGLEGISFDLQSDEKSLHIRLPLLGKHNASNAALAACCGMLYGLSAEMIEKGLAHAAGTDRRLAFEDVCGMLLLDDSYNASPASMGAALDVLSSIDAKRKVAILADMYELGSDEVPGHIFVGEKAAQAGVHVLIAIGKNAGLMGNAALEKSNHISVIKFENVEKALAVIPGLLGKGDAILVKGSNSTKVSKVAEKIRGMK